MIPQAKKPTATTTHIPVVGTGEQPVDAQPQAGTWPRSLAFTSKWEGGYQNVHNDVGNWTGGAVGVGENKGTNWGVSAASYPHLDIKNLTQAEAHAIFFRDYWQASGADKLAWPACLLVFDTAILHGVGTARAWQQEVGTNALAFAAKRLRVYTRMSNWDTWGKGWVNRTAELLEAAAK
jgi:lysozyme family protein